VAPFDYDLLVLGSGPGGQKAAIAAAKLGRRAAVVERRNMVGGVCINTGTIPSKTLREAVLYLTGLNMRELYGQNYRVKDDITVQDLLGRTQHVIGREIEVIRSQLHRNGIDLIDGTARFVDRHTVVVSADGQTDRRVSGERIVIATGTRPARPAQVAFDDRQILDSDGILTLEAIPRSMVVVGAGVIGIEYASMFAALGTRVTVVEQRDRMLDFCDSEVIEALKFHLRDLSVSFRFGEKVASVQAGEHGTVTSLVSGKRIPADTVMYSAGRQGATAELDFFQHAIEVARERDLIVVHDNAYSEVAFDGYRPPSFLEADGAKEVGVELTTQAKHKILGLNAAKLYDIDPQEHGAKLRADEFGKKAATRSPGRAPAARSPSAIRSWIAAMSR